MHRQAGGGAHRRDTADTSHDKEHHQTAGAYDCSEAQENRSWKDQSRSPSGWRQEGDTTTPSGLGDSNNAIDQEKHSHRRRQYRDRARQRSRSGSRGDYQRYNSRGSEYPRERDRVSATYDRRDRDTLSYDDDYDSDHRRDLRRDQSHRDRDRRSWSRDRSPAREYRDRDRDRNRRSRPRNRRDDGYSYGGRSDSPGEPSETVIVEGIAPSIEESDLNFGLHALELHGLLDIRIRRDRGSGLRIAFLEFASIGHAMDFVESYPDLIVTLQLPHNAPTSHCRVHISYSWAKRDDSWKDWKCHSCRVLNYSSRQECYRCGESQRPPDSADSQDEPPLNGEKDACPNQKPYPIVVVTGLESSTGEEVFSKGVMKLYVEEGKDTSQPTGPSGLKTTAPVGNTKGLGARRGSLRRVFIIRDRRSNNSWKYGFAEFATTEDATKAVTKFQASPRFTIGSREVAVAFIHTGVFVPVFPPEPQTAPFVFSSLYNPGVKLRYWEQRAYANEHLVSTDPLVDEPSPEKAEVEKKDKKRKADKDAGGVKKKTPAMAPQMQMWANKSAEIRGQPANDTPLGERRPKAVDNESKTLDVSIPGIPPSSGPEPMLSYADPNRMCCLLCQRKFKCMDMVRKHELESSLHRDNLKDEAKQAAAAKALAQVGLEPTTIETGQQYRDRAKERRVALSQPKKPSLGAKKDQPEKKVNTEASATPAPPKLSKGMAMLSKMGLKSGEGLGADGSGRTDIINTELYRPGVGLGAEGAKLGDATEEGARATRNEYGDFLAKTKEKARERFEKMSQQ